MTVYKVKGWELWLYGQVCMFVGACCAYLAIAQPWNDYEDNSMSKIHTYTVHGEDMREQVACEFEEPLKYINLIMHHYDTNEEMYADYILKADPVEHEKIWGWSSCVWQPEDSWAACDVFVVKADFVHADMNIDTLGHEVTHATCGDFHD